MCRWLMNTIATAVGVTGADGGAVEDIGDSSLDSGVIDSLLA